MLRLYGTSKRHVSRRMVMYRDAGQHSLGVFFAIQVHWHHVLNVQGHRADGFESAVPSIEHMLPGSRFVHTIQAAIYMLLLLVCLDVQCELHQHLHHVFLFFVCPWLALLVHLRISFARACRGKRMLAETPCQI